MLEPIYITGHKNPDTDSICAALALAKLKQILGYNAVPCRVGDLNLETSYVLDRFKADPPVLLETAKSRIRDIEFDPALKVHPNDTIAKAWEAVNGTKNKSLVVVDDNEMLLGVASMSSLSNILMLDCTNIRLLMSQTPLESIQEVVEGRMLYADPNYSSTGRVVIPVTEDELSADEYEGAIVLVGDNEAVQIKALNSHAGCLVIASNYFFPEELMELAKKNGVSIIRSDMDIIHISRKIYLSIPIRLIMVENPVVVRENEYVDEASQRMSKTRYRSYPVIDSHNHVVGAVSRFHLFKYRKKKFILVDHNERAQCIDAIEDAEIIEIVDHHRIGDIQTNNPIIFRNSNLGSTCSAIAYMYKEHGLVPDKQTAALMLAAILSDTLNFASPTTTDKDREIGAYLAGIAEVSTDELAHGMFAAGATLKGRTNTEILYTDFKEFVIEGCHVGIGQVSIMDPKELIDIHVSFNSYLEEINSINKYDILLMTFTNVVEQGSYFMATGKLRYVIDEVFNRDSYSTFCPGYVSRKKQIVPAIADALKR